MSKGPGTSPFAAGAIIAKKYRLSRSLGEGSAGVVWEAVRVATGEPVALKLVLRPDPETRVRLLREAHAWASIRHENVVTLEDFGETGSGDPFLVMELLSGETLAGLLARQRALPQKEAAAIGRGVARALVAAHDAGLVHRDLTPASVFLHRRPGEDTPIVKLLDLAMSGSPACGSEAHCVQPYASPEQLRLGAPVDGRSDVWSLGVVLYEMLTGERPFEGDATTLPRQILTAEPRPLWHRARKLHPALAGLVMACLRRRPEERPWPAQEIALRLEPFATAGGSRSLPPLAIPLTAPAAIPPIPPAPAVPLELETTVPLETPAPFALRGIDLTDRGTLILAPAPRPPGDQFPTPSGPPVVVRVPAPTARVIRLPRPILPDPPGAPLPRFRPDWARPEVLGLLLGAVVLLVVTVLAAVLLGK